MSNVVYLRPALPEPADAAAWCEARSSEELRRVWDSDWIEDADPGCFVLEAIHFEMNKRGLGRYVAI